MSFRKVTHKYIIEPLAGTDATIASNDYANDKVFAENRFGVGKPLNDLGYTYTVDDANKKITIDFIETDWIQPV